MTAYTEEDVDLVEQLTQVIFDANAEPWPHPQTIPAARYARAVRDFLAAAGRLVPPGWRRDTEWAVAEGDPVIWTSEPYYRREHAEHMRNRHQYVVTRELRASPWSPSVPDTKERDDA